MSVKLGHFELQDQIGQGGMGTVFKAFDPSLNRNIAIKLLDEDMAKDPQFVQDFIREAQNAAAISHPHIVQIHFVGEDEGHYYIVMELLNGRSLSAIVQDGPLPEAAVLRLATEISEALKAAYTNEMIHGDVKPQNIVLTKDNGAKLLDFGLAKLANVEVAVADGIWGSAYYVSPERVGRKAEDFRSDIYSLGATIFEALVGHPPFEAPTIEELASKRLHEKPPLLRTLNPNISKRTEQIVNKMLAKSPLLRYLDYDSLINDLRKAESALQSNAPVTETTEIFRTTTGQIPVVKGKSQLPLILMASASVVLAVGAVVFVMLRDKNQPPPVSVSSSVTPAPAASAQPVSPATSAPVSQQAASSMAAATPLPTPYGTKIRQFMYKNPDAKSVQLTGNFNQWHPEQMMKDSRGWWNITKELPRDVPLEYQYIVDGVKIPDPHQMTNVVPDGTGSLKSVYSIPREDPTPRVSHNTHTPTPAPADMGVAPVLMGVPSGAATPAETPPDAVDLTELAATPADWPKTITLKQAGVIFPVIINGKVSGEIQGTAGMQVSLVKVTPDKLTVAFQGAEQTVPVDSTDLIQRVQAARKH